MHRGGTSGRAFALVTGRESIRQRIQQRLRFFLGVWALDTRLGVPWYRDIFIRPASVGLATATLSEAIRGVDGVESVVGGIGPDRPREQNPDISKPVLPRRRGSWRFQTMARVTEAGIVALDLAGWRAALEGIFRGSLGSDLDLAPETPQGQIVGTLPLAR